MKKTENDFILELCKFIDPDKSRLEALMMQPLDYPYILGQLLYNRIGGVAYFTLRKCELLGKLNREFTNTLKAIYDQNLTKAQSFHSCLSMLSDILENSNFNYAILKGGYLVSLYEPGLRTSNDLDVLIHSNNIAKLSKKLKANGFLQGNIQNGKFTTAAREKIISSRMNRGETVPFIKKVDLPGMEYMEVDINFSLDFKAKQENDVVEKLLSHTEKLSDNGLFTFSKEDFLIHLCVHLFKEATIMNWVEMGRDLSLYKFCDIYLFAQKFIDLSFADKLVQKINEYRLCNECYYTLTNVRTLFNIKNYILDKIIKDIQPENLEFMNQIINPTTKEAYFYNMDFTDWVFCPNRKEHIYALADETAQYPGNSHYLLRFGRVR